MTSIRTEAESIAIGLELGVVQIADAVRWADDQIEAADVPSPAICDIAMASSKSAQDVVLLLRSLPGDFDPEVVVQSNVRHLLIALRDLKFDPEFIAKALYDLADALPPGALKTQAGWYWDAIGLIRTGVAHETVDEIKADMLRHLSKFVGEDSNI